jgi:CHAD domain-containing protein
MTKTASLNRPQLLTANFATQQAISVKNDTQQATLAFASPEQIAKNETMLGGYAYRIIRQQSKQVFKLRSQVLNDTDIEAVHDMRIGTRRLRSAIALFADVTKIEEIDSSVSQGEEKSGTQQTIKAVGELTKALGKVRDLDVMQEWLENIAESFSKKEKEIAQNLLKSLKQRRKKQFSRLDQTLTSKPYKKLGKHFKQWLKQPDFYPAAQQSVKGAAIERLILPVTALLQHPGWLVATHKQANQTQPNEKITLSQLNQHLGQEGESLHDLRKQLKGIRYQTEFFRGLYDITYAAQVREFRTLQNILGQLQDQIVIEQFLTDELGTNWAEQLPTVHTTFQNSRLALWQQWQPYQRRYLALRSALSPDAQVA